MERGPDPESLQRKNELMHLSRIQLLATSHDGEIEFHGKSSEINSGKTEITNSIANIFLIGHSLVANTFS